MARFLNYINIVLFFCMVLISYVVILSLETNSVYHVNLVNKFIYNDSPHDICQVKYGSIKSSLLIQGNINLEENFIAFSNDIIFEVSVGDDVELGDLLGYDENHEYFAEHSLKVVWIEYGEINKIYFIRLDQIRIVTTVPLDVYNDLNNNTLFQVQQDDEWINLEKESIQKDIQNLNYHLEFILNNTDNIFINKTVITIKVVNEDDSLDYYFSNQCIKYTVYNKEVEVELFNLINKETRTEIVEISYVNSNISIIKSEAISVNDIIINIDNIE